MPTFSLRGFAAILLIALAGCVTTGGTAPQSIAVSQGVVTIVGPRGYCVDRGLSRDGVDEAFVVLGSCAALSRGAQAASDTPVVLTASILVAPAAARTSPDDLEHFVRSGPGRAALAQSGEAAAVEILSARREGQVLLLHLRDQSTGGAVPGTDSAYWRAIFGLGDRVVTANVLAFADRPISRDDGFRRLAEFVARIKAANPAALSPS